MYNLLIVDDELIIRHGLKSTLDWNALGIKVVGDVRHGAEALEFIQNQPVNIVITDLKMPIMGGMELAEELHNKYPDIKIVILSGYEDFELARQAIKNNVQDYLLKPFSLDKLKKLMETLCSDLDEMFTYRENSRINNNLLTDTLFDLRYSFFQKYCGETTLNSDDIKSLEKLGLPSCPQSYYIALCEYEESDEGVRSDLEMIAEVLEETHKCNRLLIPFITDNSRLSLMVNREIEPESLVLKLSKISDHTLFIGVGSEANSWVTMEQSYKEASLTFKARPFVCSGQILIFQDLPETYKINKEKLCDVDKQTDELTLKLSDHIIKSDLSESLDCLGCLSELLSNSIGDFRIFRQELVKVLVVATYYLKRHGINLGDSTSTYSLLLDSTAELNNVHEVKRWARQIISGYCGKVSVNKQITYKPLVKKALRYMKERYQSPLRIEEVSEYLLISPNYLSRILKEETGLSFLNWLNQYRVEQSEKLLCDPTKKIYEISEHVGFTDYRYFSKVFKKLKHMSPKEFRNNSLFLG